MALAGGDGYHGGRRQFPSRSEPAHAQDPPARPPPRRSPAGRIAGGARLVLGPCRQPGLRAGGGNSGASYTNDFVELFNGGSSAVNLTGWSVQYASAALDLLVGRPPSAVDPAGPLLPRPARLVRAVGAALPTPDTTGTTNIAHRREGRARLGHDRARPAAPPPEAARRLVRRRPPRLRLGHRLRGARAPRALQHNGGDARAATAARDTGSSSADFTAIAPTPRNSATRRATCSSTPPPEPRRSRGRRRRHRHPARALITLERPTISFGTRVAGDTPGRGLRARHGRQQQRDRLCARVHRSAFTPADLPLAISGSAPSGGTIGPRSPAARSPISRSRPLRPHDRHFVRSAARAPATLADEHRVLVADPDARTRPLLRER
jgi:hypothetical protein